MKTYKIELTRRFYVVDEVYVQAENEEQASDIAWNQFDSLKSEIPQHVYEWVEFDESEVLVEGEADESEYQEYLAEKEAV